MIRETRQYLWLRLTVLGTGIALFSALIIASARLWPTVYQSLVPTRLTCGCAILSATTPWWQTAVAGVVILLTLLLVVRLMWFFGLHLKQSRLHERSLQTKATTRRGHLTSGVTVNVVSDDRPYALTAGFFRPKIYVSRGLRQQLTHGEYLAVLAHEKAHQQAHDPLWTAIVDSISETFRWLPGLRQWMIAGYSLRELAADAVATNGYRSTNALTSAFLKLSTTSVQPTISAFSPNRDRLEKLLNHHWKSPQKWWSWMTLASVAGITWGALALGHVAVAKNPIVPMAVACHETIIMCRTEQVSIRSGIWCPDGQCRSRIQYWSPLYASPPAQ